MYTRSMDGFRLLSTAATSERQRCIDWSKAESLGAVNSPAHRKWAVRFWGATDTPSRQHTSRQRCRLRPHFSEPGGPRSKKIVQIVHSCLQAVGAHDPQQCVGHCREQLRGRAQLEQ